MSNTRKAMNGGKWITIATVVSTVFQFSQVAVLARLLDPSDFGVVSVSNLVISFFGVFANLGFSNSIIYKQESDRKILSTIYFLNMLIGLVMFGLVYLSTPYIILFYKEPRLEQLLHVAAFYFVVVYFGQIYLFLMEKELQFRSVAMIDIVGSCITVGSTLVMAYNGYREMSMVAGALVGQVVRSAGQMVAGRRLFRPILAFSLADIKDHLRFGVFNLGDGILGFVQANIDTILIGRLLGVKQLGFYSLAYQLAVFPINKLNPIILQVAYPLLAKMKDSAADLKKSYLKILDFISYCNFPLLAGLYITADSVVPLFYGPGWEESVHLIRIFVFVSACFCISHPLFTLAFTKGKPNLLFYLNIGTVIIKVPLIYLGGHYFGTTGVAGAFLIATFLNAVVNLFIAQSLIGSFMREFGQNLVKTILFCLAMMLAVSIYKSVIGYEGPVHTIAQVAIGGLVYSGLTLAYKLSLTEIKAFRQAL